jgi:hypothetical protein
MKVSIKREPKNQYGAVNLHLASSGTSISLNPLQIPVGDRIKLPWQ